MNRQILRGDVFFVDLGDVVDSVNSKFSKKRPCLIVSNNRNNFFSSMVHIAPISSKETINKAKRLPTRVFLEQSCLQRPSTVACESILQVDKNCLISFIGHLSEDEMEKVNDAIKIQLGLTA